MKWYNKVKAFFTPEVLTLEDEALLQHLGISLDSINVKDKQALRESTVYACLKIRADAMSKLPLKLYQNDESARVAKEHPLYMLLNLRPNKYMSASNFWNCVETHKNICGNAYVYIEYGTGRKSATIVGLYPLEYSRVKIYVDDVGLVGVKNGIWYIYTDPSGSQYKLTPDDLLHFRGFTLDGIVGLNPLEYNRVIVENAKSSQEYINKFYKGGMQSKGIIEYVGDLDKNAKENFRTNFEEMANGLKNAHKISLLPVGYKFQPISLSMTDAQFIENTQLTIRQIASIYGIKMHQLGDMSSATYSNITESQKEFYVETLQSDLTMYEQECTYKLLTDRELRSGYEAKFNIDAMLRSDIKTRYEAYRIGIQSGFVTSNEVRSKEDMPPKEGGDVLLTNGNMIPVHMAGQQYKKDGDKNQ